MHICIYRRILVHSYINRSKSTLPTFEHARTHAWRSGNNLGRQDLAASDLYFMHQDNLPASFQAILPQHSLPLHCRDAKTADAGYNIQFLRWVPGTELKILRLACFGTPT